MKLPFSLKRRKKGGDDDEDDDELDFDEEDEEEDDGGYDEDDDEELEGSAWSRMDPQRKILIIAGLAAGLLLTSIFGGESAPYSTVLPPRAYEVQPTSPPSLDTDPDRPSLPAREST